jgi:hypothetical protein
MLVAGHQIVEADRGVGSSGIAGDCKTNHKERTLFSCDQA